MPPGIRVYDAARGFGFEPGCAFEIFGARARRQLPCDVCVSRREPNAHRSPRARRTAAPDARGHARRRRKPARAQLHRERPHAELPQLPANATGGTQRRAQAARNRQRRPGTTSSRSKSPATAALARSQIVAADVPTLYLAGDSTVTDQRAAPNASWGQMLPRFFAPGIAVANHAESGETLKSFVTELRFDKLLSALAAGDWVMIQFGHNDQKTQWPQTYAEAATTYRSWLRTYIAEVRRRGATPILVTSPERRNFDAAGHIVPSLGEYPDAVRAVAREEARRARSTSTAMSRRFYEALGPKLAARAFADDGRDKTHHNEYGAYALARMVVEGIRAADPQLSGGLAAHIAADAGRFDAGESRSTLTLTPP